MASHCPSLKLAEGSLHNLRRYSKALSCKTHTPKVNSTVNSLTPLWAGDPLLHSNLNVMKTAQSVKHIRIRRIVSRIGWARLNLYRFVCHYDKGCFHIQSNPFRAFLRSRMLMTNFEKTLKFCDKKPCKSFLPLYNCSYEQESHNSYSIHGPFRPPAAFAPPAPASYDARRGGGQGAIIPLHKKFSHEDSKPQRNQLYKERTSSLGVFVAKKNRGILALVGA